MEFENQTRDFRYGNDLENRSIFDYVINADMPRRDKMDIEFLARNPSMNARDGYGSSSSLSIDVESQLRLDSTVTHTRARHQLEARDVALKQISQGTEPRIQWERQGTSNRSAKGQSAERDFSDLVRTPLVPMMDAFVCNDVPPDGYFSIGVPSK